MEIHKLDYKIQEKDSFLATIFIDGVEEQQTFETFAFEKSGEKDGLYPILNCSCGEWGCGGYWVEVKHDDDKIIWKKIRLHNSNDNINRLHLQIPIAFKKTEYLDLIQKLLKEQEPYHWFRNSYSHEKKHYEETGKFSWDGFSAPR